MKKRICSPRSKFFPLRVDPIWKGLHCPGKQNKKSQKLFPFVKMIENHDGVLIYLNYSFQFVPVDFSGFIQYIFSEKSKGADQTAQMCRLV